MNWLVFGGSLLAILVLAGAAWALRLGRDGGRVGDPAAAMRQAEEALAGFASCAAVVAPGDRAALVTAEDGRVAVLKAHGARVAVREVAWSEVRSTGSGIVVDTGERRFGRVTLDGVDALDVRRLAPAGRLAAASAAR